MASESMKGGSALGTLFGFPHPVNEYASRSIAGLTFVLTVVILAAGWPWLILLLVYMFLGGVMAGPKLTPTGWLTTRVIVPHLIKRRRPVAGPPKQFAQAVGLAISSTAALLALAFGQGIAANALLGMLALFAGLEAFVGFCAGCFVFGHLMRWGLIPAELCKRCNDLNFGATG